MPILNTSPLSKPKNWLSSSQHKRIHRTTTRNDCSIGPRKSPFCLSINRNYCLHFHSIVTNGATRVLTNDVATNTSSLQSEPTFSDWPIRQPPRLKVRAWSAFL
ncbi:hypothetical protein NPIL_583321 [Nephila pilipes]|uniref:Uncharacterized protein n=1 Tax=Nephila pilipes TaxID=299642 RepID=A0A8X6QD15_NEPPI|nr:hypothetical protein NPIL_583321 [Nephila pilipes]